MNISHFPFIFFNLKLFGEIDTTFLFWSSPNFGPKTGMNLSEDLFFWSSPKFGQENELSFGMENFHSGIY